MKYFAKQVGAWRRGDPVIDLVRLQVARQEKSPTQSSMLSSARVDTQWHESRNCTKLTYKVPK